MLSPVDLLERAEVMAAAIPQEPDFEEEREVSWELVGQGWLRAGFPDEAFSALQRLRSGIAQRGLRMAFARRTMVHPDCDVSRQVLRQTANEAGALERWIYRKDWSELARVLFRVLGPQAVRDCVSRLEDEFTKANMLVALAAELGSPGAVATLEEAEQLAVATHPGNRDYALRRVLRGYERAGMLRDAERVLGLMKSRPHALDPPFEEIERILRRPCGDPVSPIADTDLERLRRYLAYRHNDLKTRWLVDSAAKGGVTDAEVEAVLVSEEFVRLELPRQKSASADPSHLPPDKFAKFFFRRAIVQCEADKEFVSAVRHYGHRIDPGAFVRAATELFSRFGDVRTMYTDAQIEHGLWYLFGYPHFFLSNVLNRSEVGEEQAVECLRAMEAPFRDYYSCVSETYAGGAFFMWWEEIRDVGWSLGCRDTARDTLARILALPDKGSQHAALHGLNHLQPDDRATQIVQRYLDAPPRVLDAEEIRWISACRDGKAG